MNNTTGNIKPEQIIEIILRRRWCIIIPFCLSMIVGLYLAITLPRIYMASTLILVERQRVPEDYVQSIVSSDIRTRINTISQQILSRTNLEKTIKQLNLFAEPKYAKMLLEDKVASVRERIFIDITQSRRLTDSFALSFKGKDPETVKQVANTLAAFFIDENLKIREAQAIGTSQFLAGELNSIRKKLEVVEEKMKNYRKNYMGELPEQLDSNLRILDRIQEQLGARQTRLSEAKNRLVLIEADTDYSIETGLISSQGAASVTNLGQLKDELATLKTKYTEKHPDIISLKKRIADIEVEISKKKIATDETDLEQGQSLSQALPDSNFARQVNEAKIEIKNLQNEISDLKEQSTVYKKRVENTPRREQELMTLRRDYENIQNSYSSLLSRQLEAEISVNMEHKQKGESFRVVDPAILPQKPAEPDMQELFLFTMAAGLGIGCGLIFLLEFLDNSFRRTEDIESHLELPVLATVPQIKHPEIILREKIHKVITGCSIGLSFILFVQFAIIVLKGPEQIVELVRKIING